MSRLNKAMVRFKFLFQYWEKYFLIKFTNRCLQKCSLHILLIYGQICNSSMERSETAHNFEAYSFQDILCRFNYVHPSVLMAPILVPPPQVVYILNFLIRNKWYTVIYKLLKFCTYYYTDNLYQLQENRFCLNAFGW